MLICHTTLSNNELKVNLKYLKCQNTPRKMLLEDKITSFLFSLHFRSIKLWYKLGFLPSYHSGNDVGIAIWAIVITGSFISH